MMQDRIEATKYPEDFVAFFFKNEFSAMPV